MGEDSVTLCIVVREIPPRFSFPGARRFSRFRVSWRLLVEGAEVPEWAVSGPRSHEIALGGFWVGGEPSGAFGLNLRLGGNVLGCRGAHLVPPV